jgi:tRNA threonylcarbamoyl adenosine modification protein (Sua5/YciO/YrdC/YwlC family)
MKTEIIKVHPEFPDKDSMVRCARIIRQGGLVIFPTETVYGIAADADNPQAVQRLRQVKRRSEGKPFSVMIADPEAVVRYSSCRQPGLFKLIARYWPGPLTVIVPGLEQDRTVGLRVPDHAVARLLIREAGCLIAAPSANIAGQPPAVSCEAALRDLDGLVEAAIDAGPARHGTASSIVDFTQIPPSIIRQGAVTRQEVDAVVRRKTVLAVCTGNSCRSVMAEYLLRDKLKGRQDVDVVSAGTNVFVTTPASAGALGVLGRRGIDAGLHRSQPVTGLLLRQADLILAMTRGHREALLRFAPDIESRLYLLKEFLPGYEPGLDSLDICDPMGMMERAYEECAETISACLDHVIKLL